jgi:hypothetical protein
MFYKIQLEALLHIYKVTQQPLKIQTHQMTGLGLLIPMGLPLQVQQLAVRQQVNGTATEILMSLGNGKQVLAQLLPTHLEQLPAL